MKNQLAYLHDAVFTDKKSDHKPVIHNRILFWNIMMQGKRRNGKLASYNNGFGIVESDAQYIKRLQKIAEVIAQLIWQCPGIIAIALCEGPIEHRHVLTFIQVLQKFTWMNRFFNKDSPRDKFYQPNESPAPNWGLIMFADTRYQVTALSYHPEEKSPALTKLVNRFQLWQLKRGQEKNFLALGHFPFGSDESTHEQKKLSADTKFYCNFINKFNLKYKDENLSFCADFNFNPYLIGSRADRAADKIPYNNSILLVEGENCTSTTRAVTVDGILLSHQAKQQYSSRLPQQHLFARIKIEYGLAKSSSETQKQSKITAKF